MPASALFDARGFDRTTVREIGDRAGVDPAMIARYFGGKQGLYLAVLSDQDSAGTAEHVDATPSTLARVMLERMDEGRGAPVLSAVVNLDPEPEVQEQVRSIIETRILRELAQELGGGRAVEAAAGLRAETMLAMLIGVVLARGSGTLEELAKAPREELLGVGGAGAGVAAGVERRPGEMPAGVAIVASVNVGTIATRNAAWRERVCWRLRSPSTIPDSRLAVLLVDDVERRVRCGRRAVRTDPAGANST